MLQYIHLIILHAYTTRTSFFQNLTYTTFKINGSYSEALKNIFFKAISQCKFEVRIRTSNVDSKLQRAILDTYKNELLLHAKVNLSFHCL